MKNHYISVSVFFLCVYAATGVRILVVPAHNMASHTKSMYPFTDALAKNGHEVYVLQLIKDAKEVGKSKQPGVTDLVLKPNVTLPAKAMPADIYWKSSSSSPIGGVFAWKMTTEVCLGIYEDDNTRRELERLIEEQWDVLIIDSIFAPCGIIAVEKRLLKGSERRPVIVDMSTSMLFSESLWLQGATVLSSTYPAIQLTEFKNKLFMDRFHMFVDHWQVALAMEKLAGFCVKNVWSWGHKYRSEFSNARSGFLFEHADFSIASLHSMLDFPRPTAWSIGDTDMACPSDAEPLPEPYASFVDDPKSKGTILFAMGHFTDWTHAPPGAIVAFIEAFARLSEYRIIWQFAQDASKLNVTSNVLVKPWIPQLGILYHPKTKVFISHMGLKSMREAICAKVPVAAMPMFAEQGRNTALARFRRFGVYLNKVELTIDDVFEKLSTLLNDEEFGRSVDKLQEQLADQIRDPLDHVASKIEFLVRRNSDRFFDQYVRIRGTSLPYVRGWSLDMVLPSAMAFIIAIVYLA